jgi:nucleoside-diphosphate-sugar epimerase
MERKLTENKASHVVFGTGPLGLATGRALLRRGHAVRLVSRSGRAMLPGAQLLVGDAYDPQAVRALTKGATAVYQCAQPAYHQWVELFPPLQASIVEGVAASGAKLVVAENLYMYGEVAGPIHENLPYNPQTRKGLVRARMAEQIAEAHRSGKLRTSSARGSDFYGPGVLQSALGERVFAAALAGKAAMGVGKLDLPHSFTYIDDFGEALATLGEREEALGRAWHVPNPETLSQHQIFTLLFELLGRPPKISAVGRFTLRAFGLVHPGAREMVEMLYEFEQPFVVDSSAYVRAFGDHATPHRTALQATLDWYAAQRQQAAA